MILSNSNHVYGSFSTSMQHNIVYNTIIVTTTSFQNIFWNCSDGVFVFFILLPLWCWIKAVMYRVLEEDYRLFRGYNVTELLEVL